MWHDVSMHGRNLMRDEWNTGSIVCRHNSALHQWAPTGWAKMKRSKGTGTRQSMVVVTNYPSYSFHKAIWNRFKKKIKQYEKIYLFFLEIFFIFKKIRKHLSNHFGPTVSMKTYGGWSCYFKCYKLQRQENLIFVLELKNQLSAWSPTRNGASEVQMGL